MKKGFNIIFLLLITVSSVQLASSETVTIQDCDDITLINSAWANNKLTPQTWKPANYPTIVLNMWKCWGVEQVLSEGRIALKFDLTSIPQGVTVLDATFSFYRITNYNGYDNSGDFNIRLINKDWNSSSATWNNLASSYDEEIIATQSYSKGTNNKWFDFDVTDAVSDMVANPSTNYGFMAFVKCSVPTNSTGHVSTIHSSESSEDDLQPKLVVKYSGTPIVSEKVKTNTSPLAITYNQAGNILVTTNTDGKYSILFHTGNGRLIGQIDNKNLQQGVNTISCNNLNLTKGLIFITLKNGGHSINSKAVIY